MSNPTHNYMKLAIDLALQGEGSTAPNPMVGCVIVRNEEVIATGWHKGPGRWHAEREALLSIDKKAEGSDLYVTLEPCCHYGRTPPCTSIIIESGVKRVFVGMVDPDPRMAGKGIAELQQAGVEVEVGFQEELCQQLNDAYVLARVEKRPRFTLKVACSLDGFICSSFGNSQWITNAESRAAGHELRNSHDGILVGIGTILADDPSLNCRIPEGIDPVPIILDSTLRTPVNAKVRTAGKSPLFFYSEGQPQSNNHVFVERFADGLDLNTVANELVQRGIYSVLVEGGALVYESIAKKGWIDRIEVFLAPIILGKGVKWLSGPAFSLLNGPQFDLYETIRYKSDIRLRYRKR